MVLVDLVGVAAPLEAILVVLVDLVGVPIEAILVVLVDVVGVPLEAILVVLVDLLLALSDLSPPQLPAHLLFKQIHSTSQPTKPTSKPPHLFFDPIHSFT